MEVLTDDDDAAHVIEAIVAAARTGKIGDGKVWVQNVEEVVRVRTGELGAGAIQALVGSSMTRVKLIFAPQDEGPNS